MNAAGTAWTLPSGAATALDAVLGKPVGVTLSGDDKLVVTYTSGESLYALLTASGELLAAPKLGVFADVQGVGLPPPAVIPTAGQLVFVHWEQFADVASIRSVAAPVTVPPDGLWATLHANQRNNRRVP